LIDALKKSVADRKMKSRTAASMTNGIPLFGALFLHEKALLYPFCPGFYYIKQVGKALFVAKHGAKAYNPFLTEDGIQQDTGACRRQQSG
jgi:hypothetical protein